MPKLKHKKRPNKLVDLQTLRTVWYKKLERSGFEDIERNDIDLKVNSSRFTKEAVRNSWHSKTEYYSLAGQFLNTYKFENNFERIIWEYHTNAISIRNIAKLLRKIPIKRIKMKANKDNVNTILKKLVHEMKKMYLVGYKGEND